MNSFHEKLLSLPSASSPLPENKPPNSEQLTPMKQSSLHISIAPTLPISSAPTLLHSLFQTEAANKSSVTIEIPTDDDPFPFGKYGPNNEALTYGEVPSRHLDWLDSTDWITDWPAVKAYIDANRKYIDLDLEQEE